MKQKEAKTLLFSRCNKIDSFPCFPKKDFVLLKCYTYVTPEMK